MGVFLFIALPTLYGYLFFSKIKILRSLILKISLSWFLGQYLSTLIIFVLAILLSFITNFVLIKAVAFYLVFLVLGLIVIKNQNKQILRLKEIKNIKVVPNLGILAILFSLIFSFLLFRPHLTNKDNKIFISPAYWDFNVHFPIIQNFVFGDNFPPKNESFSGAPMAYHFFFDLLTSIYAALGLELVGSINFVSILSFSFMLISLVGVGEEFFKSTVAGFITILFVITSSSLRFLHDFSGTNIKLYPQLLLKVFKNTEHPFFFSFLKGNPFGYNGTMFNNFYFLAERQMIFAVLFLVFYLVVIHYRKNLSDRVCLTFGLILGLFFQWHLFVTITVGLSILFLLLSSIDKRKILYLAIGFGLVCLPQFLYFKLIMKPEWFLPEIKNYPRLNFNFPTMGSVYPLSLKNALGYYIYGYGLKIIFVLSGLVFLFRKNRQIFLLLCSIILPTFVLINTIQLSPLSIYDNHKWLRPMNVILDITASIVLLILFNNKNLIWKVLGLVSFIILTLSGFIETMPLINSKPSNLYALYPTDLIIKVRKNSPPKSSFISSGAKELHLAGRKLFLGNSTDEPGATSVLVSSNFNIAERERIVKAIYSANNLLDFCRLLLKNNIDYIQFNKDDVTLPIYTELVHFPFLKAKTEKNEIVTYLNIKEGCRYKK